MSDRPHGQGLSGSSTRDVRDPASNTPTTSTPGNQSVKRTASGAPDFISPTLPQQSQNVGRSFELPPLRQLPRTESGSFPSSSTRMTGVSSILNPPQADESQLNRRRKASQLESPASSIQSLPPIATSLQGPQAALSLPPLSPAQLAGPNERPPRRILTPRSPSLHRAASLGQLNPSAGTISAQQTPFPASPRGRPYAVEPGTLGAPPLPTPPAGVRHTYGFPAPTPSSEAARRASAGAARARALSSSASPSTSYSSYSQAGQTSPTAQYVSMSNAPHLTPYITSGDGSVSGPPNAGAPLNTTGVERQRPMGIPISSSGGQNVYQMMTLETTSGTVQLPVDVQAASRVADEKRRRNAGASARFRQRRKEKEKEASSTISRLEQQVKELGEDADFYRRERDFLAGILVHVPGGERHFPRPTSPRHRRSSTVSLAGLGGGESSSYMPTQEHMPRSPDESRNVRRRRTSTFSLPPPPPLPPPPQQQQAPLPSPGIAMQPSYGSQGYSTPLASQATPGQQPPLTGPLPSPLLRGPLPTPSQFSHGQPQQQQPTSGPPPLLQALPQTGPWNPYASERRPSGPPNPPRDGR